MQVTPLIFSGTCVLLITVTEDNTTATGAVVLLHFKGSQMSRDRYVETYPNKNQNKTSAWLEATKGK